MRTLAVLFLLISASLAAKPSLSGQLYKKSGHVLQVRVCNAPGFPYQKAEPFADVYRVVVQEIYKSENVKKGDTLAISAALFTYATDTLGRPYFSNQLSPGAVFVVFLSNDAPKTFSFNKSAYPLYKTTDEILGWQPFTAALNAWLVETSTSKSKKSKHK